MKKDKNNVNKITITKLIIIQFIWMWGIYKISYFMSWLMGLCKFREILAKREPFYLGKHLMTNVIRINFSRKLKEKKYIFFLNVHRYLNIETTQTKIPFTSFATTKSKQLIECRFLILRLLGLRLRLAHLGWGLLGDWGRLLGLGLVCLGL